MGAVIIDPRKRSVAEAKKKNEDAEDIKGMIKAFCSSGLSDGVDYGSATPAEFEAWSTEDPIMILLGT
jgi:hypothetical protein